MVLRLKGFRAEAHAALEHWARWILASMEGRPISRAAIIARLIEHGAPSEENIPPDELCADVGKAIAVMRGHRHVEAIIRNYLGEAPELAARHLHVERAVYRAMLYTGRMQIGGVLAGIALGRRRPATFLLHPPKLEAPDERRLSNPPGRF